MEETKRLEQLVPQSYTSNHEIYMQGFEFFEDWFFDEEAHSIFNLERRFYLTKRELIFFRILISHKTITYETIQSCIWESCELTQNAIVLFIRNLKKKLPKNILKNIYGVGYILDLEN